MANPELVNDILLEGVRVRKESEDHIFNLDKELEQLYAGREELLRFTERDDIAIKMRRALEIFKRSWSSRKKRLIQTMLPKLVVDEKSDELNFYINPLLDKSFKNEDLSHVHLEPIVTHKGQFFGRAKCRVVCGEWRYSGKKMTVTVRTKVRVAD